MTPPQPIRTDVRGIESDLQQQARLGGAPRTRCTFAGGDFRQAPPLRSSWRGGRRRPARMLGTWERKEGRREPEERSCRGFLCVFPFFFFSFLLVFFFLCLCFNGSHQFSGRLGQRRRPTEAHKPKPGPTAVCRGVPGAATLFNTGTQNNRQGREVCSPCLSVGKKQMQKIAQHDIAYNGNSFIRQKPILPSHKTRLNLWNFHLRHFGALWLCFDGFHACLHPSKEKTIGLQVFLLGGSALLIWASI